VLRVSLDSHCEQRLFPETASSSWFCIGEVLYFLCSMDRIIKYLDKLWLQDFNLRTY
jgi:hypothetical protein